jgi:hypothetical protein
MMPSLVMPAPGPTVMPAPAAGPVLGAAAGGNTRRGMGLAVAVIAGATPGRRRPALCLMRERVSERPRIVVARGDDQHHRDDRYHHDDDDQRAGPAGHPRRRPSSGQGCRRSLRLGPDGDPGLVEVVVVEQLVTTRLGRARHADLMLGYLSAVALRCVFDGRRSQALGAHVHNIDLLERCTCLTDNRLRRFAVSVVVELGERNDLLGQRQLKGRKGAGHLFRSTPEPANSPHGCIHPAYRQVEHPICGATERRRPAVGGSEPF